MPRYQRPKPTPPKRIVTVHRMYECVFTYNLRDGAGDKQLSITTSSLTNACGLFHDQISKVNSDYMISNVAIREV
jgi:hypothetical protein